MRPAPILASFHFFKKIDVTTLANERTVDFFADSGAFSAFNSGAAVNLTDYRSWLADHHKVINFAAALDVIGNPHASRRNADALRNSVGDRVYIVPTFHVGSPWEELHTLAKEYPLLALGGGVGVADRVSAMLAWLTKAHKILAEHGAVAHGFGLTRPPYPSALPWYSIDSSYWTSATRTGSISLWGGTDFVKFRVGTRGALKAAATIRKYRGVPAAVAAPGFGISRIVGERARADKEWMERVSALSYWRYSDWIASRRPPIPAPPDVEGDGPKLYLAANDARAWRRLTDFWSLHTAADVIPSPTPSEETG